jgi:FMN-dependent NADH-azoreductase
LSLDTSPRQWSLGYRRERLHRLLYGSGTPNAPGEHLVSYLRWIFGYMGIANPEFIVAEGTRIGPENREKSIEDALRATAALCAV